MTWHLSIYDAILFSAIGGLVLLAIAAAALLLISQPARRTRVIEITLLGLLVLPLLAFIPGYPRIALLRAPGDESTEVVTDIRPVVDVTGATGVPPVPSFPSEVPDVGATGIPPVPSSSAEVPTPKTPDVGATSVPPAPSSFSFPQDFRLTILIAYLAGVAATMAWSLVGLLAVARLLRSAHPASDALRAKFREIAGPASDRVALFVSARAGQPCALVWRRPTIVLPQSLVDGRDARQLRFALAHEWSHVARGDVWSWSLSSLVRWFYFYQPLLWHLRRQLRLCQDYLADAASAADASEDYAEFLTAYSSQLKHPSLAPGLGIAGRKSELHRRVVMLLDQHQPLERSVPRRWNLLVVPLAIVVLAAVACVRAEPGDSPKADGALRPAATSRAPFSGHVRPGDKLKVDLVGGFPDASNQQPLTVEPDGSLPLGAHYGRVRVGGETLHEAEQLIRKHLLQYLKDPLIQLTYVGHDPDVVPVAASAPGAKTPEPPGDIPLPPPTVDTPPPIPSELEASDLLKPLDTVEILIPLKPQVHYKNLNGKTVEVYDFSMPSFNGIYVIEPSGEIPLPRDLGRVDIKGLDVKDAGRAIRKHLAEKLLTRTALPAVSVAKRGRAVFPEGKVPPADYRIRKGDSLLIGSSPFANSFNYEVDADGNLPKYDKQDVHVEGLTLAEAQQAVRKGWIPPASFQSSEPWIVTIGGWREEADPDAIELLEDTDATRSQRIERELEDLKNMVRQLQEKP